MNNVHIKYELYSIENENRYVVVSDNNYYNVGKVSFQILYYLKEGLSSKEIAEIINAQNNTNFYDESKIDAICTGSNMAEIILSSNKVNQSDGVNNGVYGKVTLLNPDKAVKLFEGLSFLFSKKIYFLLLFLSALITVGYIFFNYVYHNNNPVTNDAFLHVKAILLLLCIFFIHEIGHATASSKHGIKAKAIGFGFYVVFPVLYTDITEIWVLDRQKRIQINIAGIYFQLLINMVLIGLYFLNPQNGLISMLIAYNTFSILFSFNPFFKYDGYWIVSDFLNIPNLSKKANECLRVLRRFIVNPVIQLPVLKKLPLVLIIYSIFNFAFWVFFFSKFFMTVYVKAKNMLTKSNVSEWGFLTYANAAGLFITIILVSYLLFKKIKNNYHGQSNLS